MTLATLTGFRFFDRGRPPYRRWELRLSWAEITGRLGFALALCLFEDHYSLHVHLGWPNLFIKLPFLRRWHHEPEEGMESWGASWVGPDAIHLNWGRACKILHMPWSATWVRTSLLLADGSWCHETRMRRLDFPNYPLARSEKRPFFTWGKLKEQHAWRETYIEGGEASPSGEGERVTRALRVLDRVDKLDLR